MVVKEIFVRNNGVEDQVWVYLNYDPVEDSYCVKAGYSYYTKGRKDWYCEAKNYGLGEYLQEFPGWEPAISELKQEIELMKPDQGSEPGFGACSKNRLWLING